MRKIIFLFVVLGLTSCVNALLITDGNVIEIPIIGDTDDVRVVTDKWIYQPGEFVKISVTLYNQTQQSLSLTGGWDLSSYAIDGIYNSADWPWLPPGGGIIIRLPLIQPNDSYTFHFTYDLPEMQIYPLGGGWHSVVGKISADGFTGDNESKPYSFYVIPEPASAFMLVMGAMFIVTKRKWR